MPVVTPQTVRSKGSPEIQAASLQEKPWCEVEYYDMIELPAESTFEFERMGEREKLFICEGACEIGFAGKTEQADKESVFSIGECESQFIVTDVYDDTLLVRVAGSWGDELGRNGLFEITRDDPPEQETPVGYAKETSIDNHYHDCDEYWIIIEGRGTAVSEDRFYEIGQGDCLITGMGHHHDLPTIHQEPLRGVFFETTMEGQKRTGHLWEPKHGKAEPREDRI